MQLDNRNDEFTIKLIQEILEVYQTEESNIKKKIIHWLIGNRYRLIENNERGWNKVADLRNCFDDLNVLYNDLADQNSRNVLFKTIVYRILGKRSVLPTNNAEYYQKEKYIQSLIKRDAPPIPISFNNWELLCFGLDKIGYPMTIYSIPIAILSELILKQYQYNRETPFIKAETGDFVIDAGGCWGDTALYFANEVGDRGKVYTFEFNTENLGIMNKNFELNPSLKNRIEIQQKALWNKSDEILYFDDNGPQSNVCGEVFIENSQAVNTVTIDDFFKCAKIQKIDFIKMDIEGAELNALMGAEKVLCEFRPKLAISVYHNLSDFIKIPKYLKSLDLGYEFYLGHYTNHIAETMLFAIAK